MLTPDEKERIRAEVLLREEIRKALEPAEIKKGERGFWAALNSAFVVTVLGGIAIGLTGAYLQAHVARDSDYRVRLQTLQDRKYALLAQFANDAVVFYGKQGTLRLDGRWLAARPPKGSRFDGRTQVEVQKDYETLLTWRVEHPSLVPLLVQIEALYDGEKVENGAEQFRSVSAHLGNASVLPKESDADWARRTQEYTTGFRAMVAAMGIELKQELRRSRP